MTSAIPRSCSVAGCDRKYRCSGYCSLHYGRMLAYGRLERLPERSTEDLFWEKVDASGPCWEWRGAKYPNGYGNFQPSGPLANGAHRIAWEYLVGPIPPGLFIDHLCRNHGCVNSDHLEPVTPSENTRRGATPAVNRLRWADPTHCKNGHLIAENNLLKEGSRGRTRWLCRQCVEGKHGLATTYSKGCRCQECSAARRLYDAGRKEAQRQAAA